MEKELLELLPQQIRLRPVVTGEFYPTVSALAPILSASQISICFLDVSSDTGHAFQLMNYLIHLSAPPCLVAVLAENDPELILKALRGGAVGFLLRPFQQSQLQAVVRRIQQLRPEAAASREGEGKVCCIFPAKGNSGATLMAGNLAYQARQIGINKVLLADMDLISGTVGFTFKIKAQYHLADALRYSGNIDADLWKALIASYRSIDVLVAPDGALDYTLEMQNPAPMLDFCRTAYEIIILDGGLPYGDWSLRLAKLSDQVVLVLTPDPPAVYATQRVLAYWNRYGIGGSKLHVVVNRLQKDSPLKIEDIEATLGLKIFHTLPTDHTVVENAIMEGKPVATTSGLGRATAELASRLWYKPPPAPRSVIAQRLLTLFRRPIH